MNDDQMDEMLIQGVRDYNAPAGDTPREEMWRRIQAARAEARTATVPAVVPIDSRRTRRWMLPSVGVAAAAVLAVGIAIGRYMGHVEPQTAPVVASTAPSSRASDTTVKSPDTTTAGLVHQIHEAARKNDERVRAVASATPPARGTSDPESSPSMNGGAAPNGGVTPNQSLAYRLVVLQHLAGSEAMITSFRAGARNGQLDKELASWSRELLSTTRLLEASQASTDPVMKRLLDDLDLVISQIVQYTSKGTTNSEELDLIEQSINKRGVMSKLRSTIPGRNFPAGS